MKKRHGVKEKCYSCKYWERDFSNPEEKIGYCRNSMPTIEGASGDLTKVGSYLSPVTEGNRPGCSNWGMSIKFEKYINSRLLDRDLIYSTMDKILSQYLSEEDLGDEDFDKLCDELTAYYFGKVPDYA